MPKRSSSPKGGSAAKTSRSSSPEGGSATKTSRSSSPEGGSATKDSNIRPSDGGFRWDGVELLAYKEEGSAPFKAITRQLLFAHPDLGCELRYFEMQPGGHSTLERHEHVHAVMIFRGRGSCLVGSETRAVAALDLVTIPPMAWHQFRASADEPMGFLCMVNATRDKPQLPTEEDLRALRQNPAIAAFLNGAS
jgi:quercetin dioxygenase-like cupin family protein